jgi:hypothetical protein
MLKIPSHLGTGDIVSLAVFLVISLVVNVIFIPILIIKGKIVSV